MQRGPSRPWIVAAAVLTVAVGACREQPTQPNVAEPVEVVLTAADSAVVLARIAAEGAARGAEGLPRVKDSSTRNRGLAKYGGTLTDTLEFLADIDSFQIELVDRECAAASNEVSVVSPDSSVLSEWMCQEGAPGLPGQTCWPPGGGCTPTADPADTMSVWSFTAGYDSGEGVVLDFETGVGGATGEMEVEGSFPEWTVRFEDGFDSDFNDFELEITAFHSDTVFWVQASTDTVFLHPWIPGMTVNGLDQNARAGDTASIEFIAAVWAVANDEVDVTVEALFLPRTGGHEHQTDTIFLQNIPDAPTTPFNWGDIGGEPLGGFLERDEQKTSTMAIETDGGRLSFDFVAGVIGGDLQVVLETEVDNTTYSDTLDLRIVVPGLVLPDTTSSAEVYYVGGTAYHDLGDNLYVTPDVADRMDEIATLMAAIAPQSDYHLQHNDASLPFGGTFTEVAIGAGTGARPVSAHKSHALGVDIDIGWCYANASGFDPLETDRIRGTDCSATAAVPEKRLSAIARRVGACMKIHAGNHFHIRFTDRCLEGS